MAEESSFVQTALEAAKVVLRPPLSIQRGAALLYQVTVDNKLQLTVEPRRPVRGNSAFQTDLCVFDAKSVDVVIPWVVLEFKTKITTHDVLTYSAKARKHKQVYPYLRYGLVVSDEVVVPRQISLFTTIRFDFFAALKNLRAEELEDFFSRLLTKEVETSRKLENVAFGGLRPKFFRSEIQVE